MNIPKGKHFQLIALKRGDVGVPGDWEESSTNIIKVPYEGYKGSAYLTQDVSLSIENEYSNPFEGIFGGIPDTVDFVANAAGVSFKNNKLSFMKYWRTTQPLSLDLGFTFETMVDPYFDVWIPVMRLLYFCVPGESEKLLPGALVPPSSTAKVIASKFLEFMKEAAPTFNGKVGQTVEDAKNQFIGMIQGKVEEYIHDTGYMFNLFLGENYVLRNIVIKNINVTFSSETCYAPIWAVNGNSTDPGDWKLNPYSKSKFVVDLWSQTIGALMASGISLGNQVSGVLKALGFGADFFKNSIRTLPLKADVSLSIELNEPLTKISLRDMLTPGRS